MESCGQIEGVALQSDGRLKIGGWAGSSRSGATSLEVRCGDRVLPVAKVELGLPSPGVAQFIPRLPNATEAGFRIFAGEVGSLEELRGQLLRVTPHFGDEVGFDLLTVVTPIVAAPSREELDLVSKNLSVAFEYLAYFQELCGLARDARVLDVGCGVGRMAFALAHHLAPPGSYDGFDVVQRFVELAGERFRPLPHFRFKHLDVANREYNPAGGVVASDVRFPYPDASFDFVFLASVFTHMRPSEVRHYIGEIQRVLAPGGRCLASAFLLDGEALAHIANGDALLPLRRTEPDFFAFDASNPETAIGFEEQEFLGWWRPHGFTVDTMLRGSWCGRSRFSGYQDVVILSAAT